MTAFAIYKKMQEHREILWEEYRQATEEQRELAFAEYVGYGKAMAEFYRLTAGAEQETGTGSLD